VSYLPEIPAVCCSFIAR